MGYRGQLAVFSALVFSWFAASALFFFYSNADFFQRMGATAIICAIAIASIRSRLNESVMVPLLRKKGQLERGLDSFDILRVELQLMRTREARNEAGEPVEVTKEEIEELWTRLSQIDREKLRSKKDYFDDVSERADFIFLNLTKWELALIFVGTLQWGFGDLLFNVTEGSVPCSC